LVTAREGWLATIYAALYPQRINTLTLAGAPIDFHAGEPVVHEVLRHLAPGGDLRFYEALVAADGGVLKGEHMVSGFIMIQPGRRDLATARVAVAPE
jgi:poly(3-hydroxybutyrate) depolymerase